LQFYLPVLVSYSLANLCSTKTIIFKNQNQLAVVVIQISQ
jgi:hypothetical protein